MPRKTKEEAEITRKKLIHAALKLFSEKGVTHTSLNDISKAAGVTKGAFYWHFESKVEIFRAIFQEYSEPLEQQTEQMLADSKEPVSGLLEALVFYFSEIEKSADLIALYSVSFFKTEYTEELAPVLKLDQQDIQNARGSILQTLERIPSESWIQGKKGNTDLAATVILDTMMGIMTRWFREPEGSLSEQVLDAAKLILTGAGVKY